MTATPHRSRAIRLFEIFLIPSRFVMGVLYTVGHSNHEQDHFCDLLASHKIEALVDVRSSPYSRYTPQFNAEPLKAALLGRDIRYLFLGSELGGRPASEDLYDAQGRALYHRMAETPLFQQGLERLEAGMSKFRVAVMCSEEDPAVCHRFLLVTRVLRERGVEIRHIRGDGSIASDDQIRAAAGCLQQQGVLFAEMENDSWKSLRSVLPKAQPPISSDD
jgi:uncharacterized protein (DUF488 family)